MRLIYVFLLVEYSAQVHERTVWEEAPVDFIPPPNWDNYELPRPIKQYMEYEWSLSSYTNECENEQSLKIVPVYFWPGDQVDLPCLMCELAFVFNGKMKMWGKAVDVLKFLEDPKRNVRLSSTKKWSQIRNDNQTYSFLAKSSVDRDLDDRMPEVRLDDNTVEYKQKLKPFYIQRKGKLSIVRASPASQGVYFCYDSQSRSHTTIFYVVMAITPPVRMSDMKGVLTDGCYDTKDYGFIRANFNWRYHFVPNIRHEAPKQCHGGKEGFCEKNYFTQIDSEKDCTLDFCRKEFKESKIELNLALEIQWEPWGECVGGRQLQKREAHCYLVRKSGYRIPDLKLNKDHDWMTKLNALFDHEPFTSKGIRLYSSLLASLFVDENVMTKCYYEEKYEKTDRIWRVILRTMIGSYNDGKFNGTVVELDKNGNVIGRPPTFRLSNPFQACMAYDYDSETRIEHFVGTYMTETRPCTSESSRKL